MAKDEDLDIVVPSIGRASHEGDQPAEEQVDEGQEHGSSLLSERPDPTKALLTGLIRVSVPFRSRKATIVAASRSAICSFDGRVPVWRWRKPSSSRKVSR